MAEQTKPKCDVIPVCNLDLKAEHGKYAYDFEDETYWFCSDARRGPVRGPAARIHPGRGQARLQGGPGV